MSPSIVTHQKSYLYWRNKQLKLRDFAEKKRTSKKMFDFIAFEEFKILTPNPKQMKTFAGRLRNKIIMTLLE